MLAVCLVAGVTPFLAQEPPSSTTFSPIENPDSLRDYVQTLRGRLAVAGRELQIAERDLAAASAEPTAGPDEVSGLARNRDERLNVRDRIAGTIQSMEEVIQRLDAGLLQPPDRVEIPPERQLGCTDELRAAGLDSVSEFIVVVSPDGAIDRIMRVESGREVPESLDPELYDAIESIAASQFGPSLLNGESITAVYEVTFACGG